MATKPRLRYFVVDAFTNKPFAGNPAAVVPLNKWDKKCMALCDAFASVFPTGVAD